jgi:hypothetical protein
MAKILRGRISGRYGMEKHSADELHAWADRFETRSHRPDVTADDPKWLLRWANRLRRLALQKEKAQRHKGGQRTRRKNRT